jgi:hypothetical protein
MNTHRGRSCIVAKLAVVFCLAAAPTLRAQQAPPDPAAADLPGLDELLDVRRPDPSRPRSAPLDRPVDDEVSTEPFELAVAGMRQAAERLAGEGDAGLETQRIQEQVVKRLDMLISQMRRQQQRQRQQARQQDAGSQEQSQEQQQLEDGQQTGQDGQDPAQQIGNRSQADSDQQPGDQPLAEQFEEWGKLPPRLRDALRNVGNERFSELYKDLTERYYRRLAEEAE